MIRIKFPLIFLLNVKCIRFKSEIFLSSNAGVLLKEESSVRIVLPEFLELLSPLLLIDVTQIFIMRNMKILKMFSGKCC